MTKDKVDLAMTNFREFCEHEIVWYEEQIQSNKSLLEYTNNAIKREREWSKKVYQYILDKPEKDEYDLRYISAGKFETVELKKLYKDRQYYYRSTKKYQKKIKDLEKKVEKYRVMGY